MRSVAKASRPRAPRRVHRRRTRRWIRSARTARSGPRAATDLPLIAAGGLMDGRDVAAVLTAGAETAQLGTAFLRSPESRTNDTYKAALTHRQFKQTAISRAVSGRRAGGLVNRLWWSSRWLRPLTRRSTRRRARSAVTPTDAAIPRHEPVGRAGVPACEARPAGEIVDRIAATLNHIVSA